MGVKLSSTYKYQSLDSDQIVSLFNQSNQLDVAKVNDHKQKKGDKEVDDSNQSEEETDQAQRAIIELCQIDSVKKKAPKLMIKADKRRFQQVLINI